MTSTSPRNAITPMRATTALYEFRDELSETWLRFYTPARRFDLWQEYVAGAQRTYQRYRVENALCIPPASAETDVPFFAVASDDDGVVRAGWYTNGRLGAVSAAHAPSEFASEPFSAAMVAGWIDGVLEAGVMEMKGAWVDPESEHKSELADLLARSYLHALHVVGVPYAFGTAAEHAAPRWNQSGARSLDGIVFAAYPDDRYRTTFLWWHIDESPRLCAPEQRELFEAERRQALAGGPEAGR